MHVSSSAPYVRRKGTISSLVLLYEQQKLLESPFALMRKLIPPLGPSLFFLSLEIADHWANWTLLQSMLERRGYKSEWVENGQEAVDATAVRHFDLILMVLSLLRICFQAPPFLLDDDMDG